MWPSVQGGAARGRRSCSRFGFHSKRWEGHTAAKDRAGRWGALVAQCVAPASTCWDPPDNSIRLSLHPFLHLLNPANTHVKDADPEGRAGSEPPPNFWLHAAGGRGRLLGTASAMSPCGFQRDAEAGPSPSPQRMGDQPPHPQDRPFVSLEAACRGRRLGDYEVTGGEPWTPSCGQVKGSLPDTVSLYLSGRF